MIKIILHQTKLLLRGKEALTTLIVLFWIILANYVENILAFQGYDISRMYEPMKLMLLSENKTNYSANYTLVFIMLYPILLSLPAGFSYAKEKITGEDIFLITRIGRNKYFISRWISAYLTTVIVFFLPFFMDLLIHLISFPLSAKGDLTNLSIYSLEYQQMVENYFAPEWYRSCPLLYAMGGILLQALIAGILGTFPLSLSYIFTVKYKAYLVLPLFLLLNITAYLERLFPTIEFSLRWFSYLLLYNVQKKSMVYFTGFVLTILVFQLISCMIVLKKDRIL